MKWRYYEASAYSGDIVFGQENFIWNDRMETLPSVPDFWRWHAGIDEMLG